MSLLFKSKTFILGKCDCGCNKDIVIRSKLRRLARFLHGHNNANINHHLWKGGEKLTEDGYMNKRVAPSRYRRKHRVVYEEYYKCCLLDWVSIHHINGDKLDNRIENLEPMTRAQHQRVHMVKDMSNRVCFDCGGKTIIRKDKGWEEWRISKITGKFLCAKCGARERKWIKCQRE